MLAFDNDQANDWAYDLEDKADPGLVESAFMKVENARSDYLEQDPACEALAACEVLARLRGRPGYTNAYTEKVDRWVAAHPLTPSPELIARANVAIDRIMAPDSELAELWEEAGADDWRAAVEDLRARLTG